MIPVKLAVATIARLIPPLSIVIIIPMERNAIMGSWYPMEMTLPTARNLRGLRMDIRTTMPTRTKVSERFVLLNLVEITPVPLMPRR